MTQVMALNRMATLEEHKPSADEMLTIQSDVTSKSQCAICLQDVWKPVDLRDRRKVCSH